MSRTIFELHRRQVPEALEIMLRSREKTEAFVDHHNSKVRGAALQMLLMHWGISEIIAVKCEMLATEDSDAFVRQIARYCLGDIYSGTNDKRILALLKTMLRDEAESYLVRVAAYHALCKVRHRSRFHRLTF
jgi:hypothetical protein